MLLKPYIFMLVFSELDQYLEEKTKTLKYTREETKAYINSIFKGFVSAQNDLSKQSITLKYIEAKNNYNFAQFQNLADWIFFIRSVYPASLTTSPDYYDNIAKNSYYTCYMMLNRQWILYEELADNFSYFVDNIKIDLPLHLI